MTQSNPQFAVIGLVGGVGSGKSTLSQWLAERINLLWVDGDKLGHRVLRQPDVRSRLVEEFGEGILDPSGEINRSALGRQVWGDDPEKKEKRRRLEAISHPAIRQLLKETIISARQEGKLGVVLDAAVMLESGWGEECDRIVFIDTPAARRRTLVETNRGWTAEEWKQREQSQWSLERKREAADFVVDNSGSIDFAGQQLLDYVQREFQW